MKPCTTGRSQQRRRPGRRSRDRRGSACVGLGAPDQPYGDESYYVFDAAVYLGGGIVDPIGADPPAARIADEGTWVHPPLGKWIIALLGVGPIGQRSFGWRLHRRCSGRRRRPPVPPRPPSLAIGLVGWPRSPAAGIRWPPRRSEPDGDARYLPHDVRHGGRACSGPGSRTDGVAPTRGPMPWIERFFGSPFRPGAGVFLGCATATKWSGAFALPFVAVLCAIWTFTGGRRVDRSVSPPS